jgi:hypothetical protein
MGHRFPHINQVNHAANYGRRKMCDNYSKNNYLSTYRLYGAIGLD